MRTRKSMIAVNGGHQRNVILTIILPKPFSDDPDLDFVKRWLSCYACKMEPNYNALRISELRALVKEHGLRRYSRMKKDGLISFLRDSIRMETNYDDLRLVELRALVKERGLQSYYGLKKAEFIALLRDTSEAW